MMIMIIKRIICFLIAIIIGVVILFNCKPIRTATRNTFWNVVATQLDKEEKERQQKVANGEIVGGKDTILIWENLYVIGHYYDSDYLEIEENGVSNTILEKVKSHKVKKKRLYIVSEEGYAVIDKSNICRVFITVPKEDFVNGYSTDNAGVQHPISRFLDDEHVKYLNSYDDFTVEEKTMFEKMKK